MFVCVKMPGNKNSGRKKKLVPASTEASSPPKKSTKKRGRPRKGLRDPIEIDEETIVNDPSVSATTPKHTGRGKSSHVSDLRRKSSALSLSYDKSVGKGLEAFPSSRLPTKRTVLQRYRYIRSQSHNQSKVSVVATITEEISFLWDNGSIPRKSEKDCNYMVKCLINEWLNAKPTKRESSDFQNNLNNLLDIRPTDLMDLKTLRDYLKHRRYVGWERDFSFFEGQLSHPQKGSMSTTRDMVLHEKLEKGRIRSDYEKNRGEFSVDGVQSTSISPRFDINSQNIVTELDARRKASLDAQATIFDLQVSVFS